MNKEIDPYLQNLIKYLLKKKPDNVLESIKEWTITEGVNIKKA